MEHFNVLFYENTHISNNFYFNQNFLTIIYVLKIMNKLLNIINHFFFNYLNF